MTDKTYTSPDDLIMDLDEIETLSGKEVGLIYKTWQAARTGGVVGVITVEHFRGDANMQNVEYEHLDLTLPEGQHKLYTHPPQAAKVPDQLDSDIPREFDVSMARAYRIGFHTACEKMLTAAPQPVVDGEKARTLSNSRAPDKSKGEGIPEQVGAITLSDEELAKIAIEIWNSSGYSSESDFIQGLTDTFRLNLTAQPPEGERQG